MKTARKRLLPILSVTVWAAWAALAAAQTAPPPAEPSDTTAALDAASDQTEATKRAAVLEALATAADPPATLSVWNREVFVFRATLQATPAERAHSAALRIRGLSAESIRKEIHALPAAVARHEGYLIELDGTMLFGIVPADLDPVSGETLQHAADGAVARLREVLDARIRQQRPGILLAGAARAIGATMVLALIGVAGYRLRRYWTRKLLRKHPESVRNLQVGGFELGNYAVGLIGWISKMVGWALRLGLGYLWLTYVFSQFPLTEPWSRQLGRGLLSLLLMMGRAVVGSIPGLVTATLIFLAARGLARVIGGFLDGVAQGRFEVNWIYPETAEATRRIVRLAIWIFAVALAYPFLPGADSLAFKGISMLLGLTLSLGSAGILNHVMAGWVVTYSRSVRVGDYVRIGDQEGTVIGLGILAVKIVNRRNEEVTIPNAVVTGNVSTNFTRQSRSGGMSATTAVTIGYDTPWRQVHAMLIEAADRTLGVVDEPAPRVWQRALSDYYPEYELVVELEPGVKRSEVLTELHGHIQDVFNEYGVQIMSPNFVAQPDEPVLSPKSTWFAAPAAPDRDP
ncbi:MAG: mechanosensitive ion channel [Acidobacteria bacterium]|nr:mechanosensitive ion channel [Acidobacteriota bacterium]